MSLLVDSFRQQVAKSKDLRMSQETEFDVYYSTGFLPFDFMNGTKIEVEGDKEYYGIGIQDGSINMIIGRSGCGKTTWAEQAAANIIRPYENSAVFEDIIEGGISIQRKEILTGFRGQELKDRYISRNTGINVENIYERIKIIHDDKLANKESYIYDTGYKDTMGNEIFKLQPTVYIIDSLSLIMPEKYTEEEELSGQMSTTASAKANASLFRRITPLLKMANIIVFVINHINQKVEINQFARTKSQISYLKQGETLPGGNTPIYLSNNIIRFDDNSKLKSDKEFGIDGAVVDVSLLKSRSASVNQSVPLVFNFNTGFDNELSMYLMLKNKGLIKGAGIGYYIDGSNIKFSQKNLKDHLFTNEDFAEYFYRTAIGEMQKEIKERTNRNDKMEATRDSNFSRFAGNPSIPLE